MQEQHRTIALEIHDRYEEGVSLGNLGNCYVSLGYYERAIKLYEQSLKIAREISDRYGEGDALTCLGSAYRDIRQIPRAFNYYEKAINLADESGNQQTQHEARFGLAETHLFQSNLIEAHKAIKATREYDYPSNNAAAWTLTGIIRLRLEDLNMTKEALEQGLKEAERLLKMSEKNFSALETKALSLCGLAICDDPKHLTMARQAFQAARNITQAKGVVTRLLNRFDALALADTENILAPLRKVAAGE
ncbi:MAG: tetratricopeptide repeat protein [Cyanobacteria bacterium J06598_3]